MKITAPKRIKEKYRVAPLWISIIEHDGQREEVVGKTLKSVLLILSAKTGIPYNTTRNAA